MKNYSKYTDRLTELLKNYLVNNGFYNTGRLYESVQFSIVSETKFKLILTAMEYIIYLDNGNLLDNYFINTEVQEVLNKLFGDYVFYQLTESYDPTLEQSLNRKIVINLIK